MPQHVARTARLPTPDRPKRTKRVGKKLFHAIELIVFEGKELGEAAAEAGLTTYTLRQAFARPQVLAHLRERREVFRAAVSGKNILRLCQIRDAENNMPAVHAIKALEQIGDEQANKPNLPSPGISIRIVQMNSAPAPSPFVEEQSESTFRPFGPKSPLIGGS
jgi:hypothetical protein